MQNLKIRIGPPAQTLISRFLVRVLHMTVIFMSTEAKTRNTIFSRKKKELSVKSYKYF